MTRRLWIAWAIVAVGFFATSGRALAATEVSIPSGGVGIHLYCTVGQEAQIITASVHTKCTAPPTLDGYELLQMEYFRVGSGGRCSTLGCTANTVSSVYTADATTYAPTAAGYFAFTSPALNASCASNCYWSGNIISPSIYAVVTYSSDGTSGGTLRRYGFNNGGGTTCGSGTCYAAYANSMSINGSPGNTVTGYSPIPTNLTDLDALQPPAYYFAGGVDPDEDWTNACTQYSVGGLPGSTLLRQGDVITLTIEHDSGADPVQLDIQFRPGTAWFPLLSPEHIAPGGLHVDEVSVTYSHPAGESWLLEASTVRCLRDGEETSYVVYGDDGWDATEGVTRACERADVIWPSAQPDGDGRKVYDVDDPVTWVIRMIGVPSSDPSLDEILSVGVAQVDGYEANLTVPWGDAATYEDVTSWTVMDMGDQQEATVLADYEGTEANFALRCEDSEGYYYRGQWRYEIGGALGNGSESAQQAESCYSKISVGLAPSSWLPGAGRLMTCLARSVVVPSDAAIEDLKDHANALSERAPVSFLTETGSTLASALSALPGSVSANRNNCIQVMATNDVTGEQQELCPAVWADAQPIVQDIREWLGYLFWFGVVWAMWGQTQNLLAPMGAVPQAESR